MKSIVITFCSIVLLFGWSSPTHGIQSDSSGRPTLSENLPITFWQLKNEHLYYRADMDGMNWREIRAQKKRHSEAGKESKFFELKQFCLSSNPRNIDLFQADAMQQVMVVVRDPNGIVSRIDTSSVLAPESESDSAVQIPRDTNLNGRYLLGGSARYKDMAVDHDGDPEAVHLCAKYLIGHHKSGGTLGEKSVVFIDDPTVMPLEIGPVINTAKSKYGGAYQRPHRTYEMMVKYNGEPLPYCYVRLISFPGQWEKTFMTDDQGIFKVMPMDDREFGRERNKYLFAAFHHDQNENTVYVSTFPVNVPSNRPEWRSKAMGFALWAIAGSVLTFIMVWALVRRREKQHRREMIVFKDHTIKRESKSEEQTPDNKG